MSNAMKVKTLHMINGRNVVDMTKEEMIQTISDAEAKVKELGALETESTAVTKEIEKVKTFIADVVKHLDAKA